MTHGRKACRTGETCQVRTLTEAIYHQVHHSAADARVVAERLGVRYSYLLDAANPDRDEVQFQARLLVPLMVATSDITILEWMAAQVGCVVTKAEGLATPDPGRELLDVIDRLGALAAADRDAAADGVRDAGEIELLKTRAHAVAREVAEYVAALSTSRGQQRDGPVGAANTGRARKETRCLQF